MAKDDISKFQAVLNENSAVQTQADAVLQHATADQATPLPESSPIEWAPLIQLAAEHGYTFTAEDLVTTFLSGDRELTEAELGQAVGMNGNSGLDMILTTNDDDILNRGGTDDIDGFSGNDVLR